MQPQPRADHIVKPMLSTIPLFELQPLERAKTDRAANDEGKSDLNITMLIVAIIGIVFILLAAAGALYAAMRGLILATSFFDDPAARMGFIFSAAVVAGIMFAKLHRIAAHRRAKSARRPADAGDAVMGELA